MQQLRYQVVDKSGLEVGLQRLMLLPVDLAARQSRFGRADSCPGGVFTGHRERDHRPYGIEGVGVGETGRGASG